MRLLAEHRLAVPRGLKVLFPNDALKTPLDKLKVLVVQGFGRFVPFGPRHSNSTWRYDAAQDWGARVWIASVVAGVPWWLSRGKRQMASGETPTALAILVESSVALAVVTAYLPLPWDRYFLSIQPGSALLAAGATVAAADSLIRARPCRGPIPTSGAPSLRMLRRPESWVFFILLGSFAFFWHSRDWNCASRLMLTYALVDPGRIQFDGLEDQTGDKAMFQGHHYTDKFPGFPFLAAVPYAAAKAVLRLPDHPLNRRGLAYWAADYWVTPGTSGVLSALAGALLVSLACDLGCGPRRGAGGRAGVRLGDPCLCLRDDELRASGVGVRAARVVRAALATRGATPRAQYGPGGIPGEPRGGH